MSSMGGYGILSDKTLKNNRLLFYDKPKEQWDKKLIECNCSNSIDQDDILAYPCCWQINQLPIFSPLRPPWRREKCPVFRETERAWLLHGTTADTKIPQRNASATQSIKIIYWADIAADETSSLTVAQFWLTLLPLNVNVVCTWSLVLPPPPQLTKRSVAQ